MDDYERVLLVKPDVHVYRIPPRISNRAYRASDWNLDEPNWNCRLRFIAKGSKCFIKLDEKSTGQFFGQCPIEKYPGPAIEAVSDSSRYFVLRLVNEETNRTAFVGIGFVDRSDSFDLNVALQDHFKIIQMEENSCGEKEENLPKLDLGFKEGQTIKVNLNIVKKLGSSSKPRPKANTGGILLPPPPAGKSISKPESGNNSTEIIGGSKSEHSTFGEQLVEGIDSLALSEPPPSPPPASNKIPPLTPANSFCGEDFASFPGDTKPFEKRDESDSWSDFASFNPTQTNPSTQPSSTSNQFDNWAKF